MLGEPCSRRGFHAPQSLESDSKACPATKFEDAEIVNAVADPMRREMYRNIDLEDLLHPAVIV